MPQISERVIGSQKFRPAFGPIRWRMLQEPDFRKNFLFVKTARILLRLKVGLLRLIENRIHYKMPKVREQIKDYLIRLNILPGFSWKDSPFEHSLAA